MSNKKKTYVLTITNRCNLDCTYCYEALKNNHSMSIDTAKSIMKDIFDNNKGNTLQIDFHGGEPLINFDLIKDICEWSWSEKRGCKYLFFVGSNGTLFTPEIKEWFATHKDRIQVGLSLDGTPMMQNVNRSNSFKSIDLDFFSSNWSHQTAKMTISKETLPHVAEGVKFIHSQNLEVSFNLAYGLEWDSTQLKVWEEQLDQIVEYYINNPNIKIAANFEKKLYSIFSTLEVPKHCGAGTDMKAYDTHGREYPCHMFSSNVIDAERWNSVAKDNFADEDIYRSKECDECPIYRVCPTCYGMNFIERNSVSSRDMRLCEYNKLNTAAICKLRIGQLVNKSIDDFTKEEYLEFKAAKQLLDTLNAQ